MKGPVSINASKDKGAEQAQEPSRGRSDRSAASGLEVEIRTLQRAAGNMATQRLLRLSTGSPPSTGNGIPPMGGSVLRNGGSPSEPATRILLESRFNRNFSQVRESRPPPLASTTNGKTTIRDEALSRPEAAEIVAHESVHRSQYYARGKRPLGTRRQLEADAHRGATALLAGNTHTPSYAAPQAISLQFLTSRPAPVFGGGYGAGAPMYGIDMDAMCGGHCLTDEEIYGEVDAVLERHRKLASKRFSDRYREAFALSPNDEEPFITWEYGLNNALFWPSELALFKQTYADKHDGVVPISEKRGRFGTYEIVVLNGPKRGPYAQGTTIEVAVMRRGSLGESSVRAPGSITPGLRIAMWAMTSPSEKTDIDSRPGPRTRRFVLDQVGRWEFAAQFEPAGVSYKEIVGRSFDVRDPKTFGAELLRENKRHKYDFARFRISLGLERMRSTGGATQEQPARKPGQPYITVVGNNPAQAETARANTYTIHRSGDEAAHFQWYVLASEVDILGGAHGDPRGAVIPAAGPRDSRKWGDVGHGHVGFSRGDDADTRSILLSRSIPNLYTVVCLELDEDRQYLGTKAIYRQAVLATDEWRKLEQLTKHIDKVDRKIRELIEGTEVPIRAVHVDRQQNITPIALFAGRVNDAADHVRLLDLTPNAPRTAYTITSPAGRPRSGTLIDALKNDNEYPEGFITVEVPANELGIETGRRTFQITRDDSWASTFSTVSGWISLGSTALGFLSLLGPGTQGAAPFFFGLGAASGVAASGANLIGSFLEDRATATGVAIDLLGIAANLLSLRTAQVQGRAASLAAKGEPVFHQNVRYLLYTQLAVEGSEAVLITVETIVNIDKILDDDARTRGQKIDEVIRVLRGAALTAGLFVHSARGFRGKRSDLTKATGAGGPTDQPEVARHVAIAGKLHTVSVVTGKDGLPHIRLCSDDCGPILDKLRRTKAEEHLYVLHSPTTASPELDKLIEEAEDLQRRLPGLDLDEQDRALDLLTKKLDAWAKNYPVQSGYLVGAPQASQTEPSRPFYEGKASTSEATIVPRKPRVTLPLKEDAGKIHGVDRYRKNQVIVTAVLRRPSGGEVKVAVPNTDASSSRDFGWRPEQRKEAIRRGYRPLDGLVPGGKVHAEANLLYYIANGKYKNSTVLRWSLSRGEPGSSSVCPGCQNITKSWPPAQGGYD